ncbi:MAG: hypothetical protein IK101_02745 [Oscillospiraceae bacterium]|nr:hypothetical protein [Oscillospiraceae bacterium]
MDGRRIKTLVILILLTVNLFFGGIIIMQRAQSRGMEAREREELSRVMSDAGIELPPDMIPRAKALKRCSVVRDASLERAFAAALIGEAEPVEQGGGIVSYENENGRATFRSGGEVEAVIFDKSALSASVRAEDYVAGLLGKSGFEIKNGELVLSVGGMRVFNCVLTATAADEGIVVEGRRLTGAPSESEEAAPVSAYTALMAYLRAVSEDGSVVKQIVGVTQGYVFEYSASAGTLEPVWRIQSDGGAVYISAVDAEIIRP